MTAGSRAAQRIVAHARQQHGALVSEEATDDAEAHYAHDGGGYGAYWNGIIDRRSYVHR